MGMMDEINYVILKIKQTNPQNFYPKTFSNFGST